MGTEPAQTFSAVAVLRGAGSARRFSLGRLGSSLRVASASTAAVTTAGMGTDEMVQIAEMIATVLRAPEDSAVLDAVRTQANVLCARFVPYPDLV